MEIGNRKPATKCTKCLRTKEEAIEQQSLLDKPCEVSGCPFREAIEQELEKKNRKPPFDIRKRAEPEKRPMKITKVQEKNGQSS